MNNWTLPLDSHIFYSFSCARVEDQGNQQPTKHPEVTRLGTAKNGLELVEHVVSGGGNACALSHVDGLLCDFEDWQISKIRWNFHFSRLNCG